MIVLILFSFIAGIVTILSPCILPILPIVLSGSLTGGKHRPLGVILGFILSFTFFATFSFALARSLGLSTEILRQVSVVFLLLFGLTIIVPKFQVWLEKITSTLMSKNTIKDQSGFKGGIVLGISLGFVWTPCVGPILASVLTIAATQAVTLDLLLITFAYSMGTAIPLFFIAHGGKRVLNVMPALKKNAATIQKVFGVLIIGAALMIQFNLDRQFQTFILDAFPSYGEGITSFEDNELVQKQLDKLRDENNSGGEDVIDVGEILNQDYPAAPNRKFEGGGTWLNSDPLTLDELEGKVVLVDFWTYTCINCIRTFPYVTSWYEKYKDDGFVIIGVHTPEFEFEKDTDNVADALIDYKITYPVVQDNDFKIWRSYNNRYWPAHYLIDKSGKVRYTHFGEGKYDETEEKIRELLEETGADPDESLLDLPSNLPLYRRTPESYLGYGRMDRFASPQKIVKDLVSDYTAPKELPKHFLAFDGSWLMSNEHSLSSKDSALEIHFESKEVFLVMTAHKGPAEVRVLLDGELISADMAGEDVVDGVVKVDTDRLYKLVKLDDVKNHILRLEFPDKQIEVFAFTFG